MVILVASLKGLPWQKTTTFCTVAPRSHNRRPWEPCSRGNLHTSLGYLLWTIPEGTICFYVWLCPREVKIYVSSVCTECQILAMASSWVITQVGPLDCQVEEDSIILGSRHTFRCVDIYVSTLEFVLTIGVSHTVRPKKSAILYM